MAQNRENHQDVEKAPMLNLEISLDPGILAIQDYLSNDKKRPEIQEKARSLGFDDESMFIAASVYSDPERLSSAADLLKFHKGIDDPDEKIRSFISDFKSVERSVDANFDLIDAKKRILEVSHFFGVDKIDKKVLLVPGEDNSGRSIPLENELILVSHPENPSNIEHEFLHSIINSVAENIELTDEKEKNILNLATAELRSEYGADARVLLGEEIIRTYVNYFRNNEEPLSQEKFMLQIGAVSEDWFFSQIEKNEKFRLRCEDLKITNLTELKDRSGEYFEKFVNNKLREKIFAILKKYALEGGSDQEKFKELLLSI